MYVISDIFWEGIHPPVCSVILSLIAIALILVLWMILDGRNDITEINTQRSSILSDRINRT